jgi:hypothetical protein
MVAAYFQMFQQIMKIRFIVFICLPAIEIYRTTNINPDFALNHTELLLPVRRLAKQEN